MRGQRCRVKGRIAHQREDGAGRRVDRDDRALAIAKLLGGDLLHRIQVFVNGLAGQAERFRVPVELVIVEWNPPEDRPSLADAVSWPASTEYFGAHIIEVPREVHLRLENGDRLPLFQMIAKNVGIRRARGRFVLATNVDVLLSDELMTAIAARKLNQKRSNLSTTTPASASSRSPEWTKFILIFAA